MLRARRRARREGAAGPAGGRGARRAERERKEAAAGCAGAGTTRTRRGTARSGHGAGRSEPARPGGPASRRRSGLLIFRPQVSAVSHGPERGGGRTRAPLPHLSRGPGAPPSPGAHPPREAAERFLRRLVGAGEGDGQRLGREPWWPQTGVWK